MGLVNSYTNHTLRLFVWKWALRPLFCFKQMKNQDLMLFEMLQPVVSAMGYELWGVEHTGGGQGSLLRVYIDKQSGISLTDCERVSSQMAGILDTKNPIRGSYTLEVSSPGMDRPLFTLGHFNQFMGHEARIRLHGKLQGRKNIVGRIVAVGADTVTILENSETFNVPLVLIDKANLVYQSSGYNAG